jgi:hypothetical protein
MAPDIVRALVEERQPIELTATRLRCNCCRARLLRSGPMGTVNLTTQKFNFERGKP